MTFLITANATGVIFVPECFLRFRKIYSKVLPVAALELTRIRQEAEATWAKNPETSGDEHVLNWIRKVSTYLDEHFQQLDEKLFKDNDAEGIYTKSKELYEESFKDSLLFVMGYYFDKNAVKIEPVSDEFIFALRTSTVLFGGTIPMDDSNIDNEE